MRVVIGVHHTVILAAGLVISIGCIGSSTNSLRDALLSSLDDGSTTGRRTATAASLFDEEEDDNTNDEKEMFPACLDRSVSILCHAQYPGSTGSTDDDESSNRSRRKDCLNRPRGAFASVAAVTRSSSERAEARRLLVEREIRHVSIGANKVGLCNMILKQGRTLCTDRPQLDLFEFASWVQLFGNSGGAGRADDNDNDKVQAPPLPEVLHAEHVLEHFQSVQIQRMAAAAFATLAPGGVFRIAVPDGYKPSPSYQEYVRPGKVRGALGQAHMVSWTIDSLAPIFQDVGFIVVRREYFDDRGNFHTSDDAYGKDEEYGRIKRSFRRDERNAADPNATIVRNKLGAKLLPDLRPNEPRYTSLWFDAVKPKECTGTLM